jgi:hypothetical protein
MPNTLTPERHTIILVQRSCHVILGGFSKHPYHSWTPILHLTGLSAPRTLKIRPVPVTTSFRVKKIPKTEGTTKYTKFFGNFSADFYFEPDLDKLHVVG